MTKKSTLSILMILILLITALTFTGCGSSGGTSSNDNESEEEVYEEEEEEEEEEVSQGAVSARLELTNYEFTIAPGEEVRISGEINHSYGQDIIVLCGGEEVARTTLEGRDGDHETFKVVVPEDVLSEHLNYFKVKGGEIPGVVEETYTKSVTVKIREIEE